MRSKKRTPLLFMFMLLLVTCMQGKPASLQAVAVPVEADAVSASGSKAAIRVMSYNIHRGIGKDGKLNMDRIFSTISDSKVDIVALQEVERYSVRTGFQDQIAYLADKLSMNYVYGKSMNILNGQYGNAVLSRYPIKSSKVSQLPSKGENRILLSADLSINGKSLGVHSTHLGLDRLERSAQLASIAGLLQDCDGPHVLAGDFNAGGEELSVLCSQYLDSAVQYGAEKEITFEYGTGGSRIDYLLLSGGLVPIHYEVVKSDASDHFPIISTIKMK